MVRRYGFTEGTVLAKPIVEFYLKDDDLDDPLMIAEHAVALGLLQWTSWLFLNRGPRPSTMC